MDLIAKAPKWHNSSGPQKILIEEILASPLDFFGHFWKRSKMTEIWHEAFILEEKCYSEIFFYWFVIHFWEITHAKNFKFWINIY